MHKKHYNNKRNCVSPRIKNGNNALSITQSILDSDNPAKWVAGIGLGALAVAGVAIKVISELSRH